jgi:MYXO-CTERM domain-containing protein
MRWLVASLLMVASSGLTVEAATYRNLIAQVPGAPTEADTVRIWMESDTAFGETAGVEYQIGPSYVKVLGAYDAVSGPPPANWYADIPAQPAGTTVAYQLFTRNEVGTDYGFTGFNWSYVVAATPTIDAGVPDGAIAVDAAPPPIDAAVPAVDAATSPVDAAPPPVDAAVPAADAAPPLADAGPPPPDAAPPPDGASPDAGAGPSQELGCGCAAAGRRASTGAAVLLVVAVVALRRRNR